jgi:hypothetical protein
MAVHKDYNPIEEIRIAAAGAVEVIVKAASEAGKVVSDAASVAVGVLGSKPAVDHDLLIELRTQLVGLKDDIKDIKTGTSNRIAEHEKRLCDLEGSKSKSATYQTIGIGLLIILTSMLIYHLFGIKI